MQAMFSTTKAVLTAVLILIVAFYAESKAQRSNPASAVTTEERHRVRHRSQEPQHVETHHVEHYEDEEEDGGEYDNVQDYEPSAVGDYQDCAPEAMARCTDPLKVVTDNKDLGFATSQEELDKMCPKLMDGLRCIDEFTYRCLDDAHRNYFNTLYQGTTQVIVELCQQGEYQSNYLRHAPCMRKVQIGYEQCADDYQIKIKALNSRQQDQPTSAAGGGDAGVRGVQNVQMLCCSFQQYLRCSEGVVNATCGYDTARFTKSFLDRMAGPLIQGHCHKFDDLNRCHRLPRFDSGEDASRPLWTGGDHHPRHASNSGYSADGTGYIGSTGHSHNNNNSMLLTVVITTVASAFLKTFGL